MKNSSYTIGNRNRHLPACSTVPQPTAPLHAPIYYVDFIHNYIFMMSVIQKIYCVLYCDCLHIFGMPCKWIYGSKYMNE